MGGGLVFVGLWGCLERIAKYKFFECLKLGILVPIRTDGSQNGELSDFYGKMAFRYPLVWYLFGFLQRNGMFWKLRCKVGVRSLKPFMSPTLWKGTPVKIASFR